MEDTFQLQNVSTEVTEFTKCRGILNHRVCKQLTVYSLSNS